MLTPAFHFSILSHFVEIFDEHALQLRENLMQKAIDGSPFDVYPVIGHSALDIICDTAMGVSIEAQKNENSEYVTAVKRYFYAFKQKKNIKNLN